MLWRITCTWSPPQSKAGQGTQDFFQSVDLLLRAEVLSIPGKNGEESICARGTALYELVERSEILSKEREVAVKVILVPRRGFLSRRDIIQLRMRDAEFVTSVVQFPTSTDEFAPASEYSVGDSLPVLLESSPAALVLKEVPFCYEALFHILENELKTRLSFNWVLKTKAAPYKIALVNGGAAFSVQEESFSLQGAFEAAKSLDISLVVLDKSGHWLEKAELSQFRHTFITIDMSDDGNLPARIYETLRNMKLDGIVTFSEAYLVATADAANRLGLRSEPVESFINSHNKYETRLSLGSNAQVLRLEDSTQLQDGITTRFLTQAHYPLIVKPCEGGGSRGVRKALDQRDLYNAVHQIEKSGLSQHGILIEPYVDGPEVDANFVLWDGKILFSEISDQPPCPADGKEAGASESFLESSIVLPSRLPDVEQETIRVSLHKSLIKLGFRSGVFHLEARVRNSSMQYQCNDGVTDLVLNRNQVHSQPEAFLIEINARPPGHDTVYATLFTYGVDYFGLHLLNAAGDAPRFKALSIPFTCQAQYWTGVVLIPMPRNPVYVPFDFCQRVIQQLSAAAPTITLQECFRPNETVSCEYGTGLVATFILYSRKSRKSLLEMAGQLENVSSTVLGGP